MKPACVSFLGSAPNNFSSTLFCCVAVSVIRSQAHRENGTVYVIGNYLTISSASRLLAHQAGNATPAQQHTKGTAESSATRARSLLLFFLVFWGSLKKKKIFLDFAVLLRSILRSTYVRAGQTCQLFHHKSLQLLNDQS